MNPRQVRLDYFDWLRALAVAGVVAYHTLQPFGTVNWPIANSELQPVVTVLVGVLASFGMPILFLVAGASACFALQRRSAGAFLRERAQRLLVPFTVGTVVLGPINGYILAVFQGTALSFPEYLVAFPGIVWEYNVQHVGLSMRLLLVGVHLWFLGALFVFSAAALPVFALLSSARGRRLIDQLAHLTRWPGTTLLFAVPTTAPIVALFASTTRSEVWDNWSFGWFGVVFLIGYVIYSDHRLVAAARRDSGIALVVALLGTAGLASTDMAHWVAVPQWYGTTYFLMLSLFGITGWAWTVAVLGLGMRAAFMQRPLPARVGDVSLPLYILHYPIVSGISVLVVRSPLDLGSKILINLVLGVALSFVLAVAAVRVPFCRPLLGIRGARPTVTPSPRTSAIPSVG